MEKHRSLIWSAFPVVYGAAFLLTLGKAVVAFWASELPVDFYEAFPLDSDRVYARWNLNIFSTAVGVFMVVLYVRLEMFEHNPKLPGLKEKGMIWRMLEYLVRVCIVAIITWKIIQWNDYDTLLNFYMILTIVFAVWILVLKSAALQLALPQKMSYFLMPVLCLLVNYFGSVSAIFAMTALTAVATLTALGAISELISLFQRAKIVFSSISLVSKGIDHE